MWRSLDGGESWTGLNDALPNLAAQRILVRPGDGGDLRIVAAGKELIWRAGERTAWRPAIDSATAQEQQRIASASASLGIDVSAASGSGDILYAGSADGSLFFSRDRGLNWGASGVVAGAARIERIKVDTKDPTLQLQSRNRVHVAECCAPTLGVFFGRT